MSFRMRVMSGHLDPPRFQEEMRTWLSTWQSTLALWSLDPAATNVWNNACASHTAMDCDRFWGFQRPWTTATGSPGKQMMPPYPVSQASDERDNGMWNSARQGM